MNLWKTYNEYHTWWWKTKRCLIRLGTRYKWLLTTYFKCCTGSSSQCNQSRKRNKRHPDWTEVKLSVFADDMYYFKEYTHTQFRTNMYNKVTGYKINTWKLMIFPQAGNEQYKYKINNTFHNSIKKNKIFESKVTKKESQSWKL